MVLSANKLLLNQELNSSKSHTGQRKRMYYLKYGKIVLKSFCVSGPETW